MRIWRKRYPGWAIACSAALLAAPAAAAPAAKLNEAMQLGDLYVLPAPDLSKVDLGEERKGRPREYGLIVPLVLPAVDQAKGQWQDLGDGRAMWHWSVASPGAFAMEFQFSRLQLPPSATLTIHGEDKELVRTITASDVARERYRTPLVIGERATLELHVASAERSYVDMALESVTHAFRSPLGNDVSDKSASCNVDIACAAANAWQNLMASVALYTFPAGGGLTGACTGTLLGNKTGSNTPYFLTAHHCVDSQAEADDVTVYWNYESVNCRAPGSAASGTPLLPTAFYSSHTQTGATLRAKYAPSDTTLLQLDLPVSAYAMAFYAGWTRSAIAPIATTTLHHAQGHEKRFSRDNQAPALAAVDGAAGSGTSHWRVADWDVGTTQKGSSGAPLFNPSGLVMGVLTGGDAACGNNEADWFGRLASAWEGGGSNATRLKNWLDPAGTNVTSMVGYYASSSAIQQKTIDLAIPDLAQVQSQISVIGQVGNGGVGSRVKVRLNHTHIGDLIVELIGPDGDKYLLHNVTGGGLDNLHKIYTKNLSGSPKNGVWTLRISDTGAGDAGLLDYWSIMF